MNNVPEGLLRFRGNCSVRLLLVWLHIMGSPRIQDPFANTVWLPVKDPSEFLMESNAHAVWNRECSYPFCFVNITFAFAYRKSSRAADHIAGKLDSAGLEVFNCIFLRVSKNFR